MILWEFCAKDGKVWEKSQAFLFLNYIFLEVVWTREKNESTGSVRS